MNETEQAGRTGGTAHRDGLPPGLRRGAIVGVLCAAFMMGIDIAAISAALPSIAGAFGVTADTSVWIITVSQIATMMFLLPAAAGGEIIGFQRVFMIGLAVFTLASLGCALMASYSWLVALRFVQGAGAAGMMATYGAVVRYIFPERHLARGIALVSFSLGAVMAAGPMLAAAAIALGSWRWLFLFPVPIGAIGYFICARTLPDTGRSDHSFDLPSAVLSAIAFGALFFAFSRLAGGKAGAIEAGLALIGLLVGFFLIRRSIGQERPFFPLDLLAQTMLRHSYLTSILSFAAHMMLIVALPFLLHYRSGLKVAEAALLISTLVISTGVVGLLAARLVERVSISGMCSVGLAITAGGSLILAQTEPDTSALGLAVRIALVGIGFGLFQTPNNRILIGYMPRHRSGAAGVLQAIARLIGQTVGAVLVGIVLRLFGPASIAPLLVAATLAALGAIASFTRISHERELRLGV